MPLVRPDTSAEVGPALLAVRPPGDDVTVYPVIALPPLDAGAVQVTVAWVLPAVATTLVGAPGTVAAAVGVTEFDGPKPGRYRHRWSQSP